MDFTIMIPTRKRPIMIQNLLFSIYHTAKNKNQVETIVMYDEDDIVTCKKIEELKLIYINFPVRFIERPRHYSINNSYYNGMAKLSQGEYLVSVNDDTTFMKFNWDIETIDKLNKYMLDKPDGIVYGIVEDSDFCKKRVRAGINFSCFPLISKKAVNTLGFFFDPVFPKDGADWDIFGLYSKINRVVDLRKEFIIEHISVRSGRRVKDELDSDLLPLPAGIIEPQAGINTIKYIDFLENYIKNYKNE
jgi:hypothetical protein